MERGRTPGVTFGPTRGTGAAPTIRGEGTGREPVPERRWEPRVILVDEMPAEAGGGSVNRSVAELRLEVDRAWRDDVVLEMWIDATSDPVAIRLAGVLDESTGANLLGVVEDCVAQGQLDFDLDTERVPRRQLRPRGDRPAPGADPRFGWAAPRRTRLAGTSGPAAARPRCAEVARD